MKAGILVLKAFGYIWVTLAVLLVFAGMVGIWMQRGFSGVQEVFNPFDIANFVIIVLTFAPGVGALTWADKLKTRQASK